MAKLTIEAGVNAAKFRTGLASMRNELGTFSAGVKSAFGGIAGALGMTVGIATIKSLADEFSRVVDLSDRLNTSTASIQRISEAAGQFGTDLEVVMKQLTKLNGELSKSEPSKDLAETWKTLGINTAEWLAMSPEDQLVALSKGLAEAEAKGQSVVTIYKLLGARGAELTNILQAGPEALQETFDKVTVLNEALARSIEEANDQLDHLFNWAKVQAVGAINITIGSLRLLGQGLRNVKVTSQEMWASIVNTDGAKNAAQKAREEWDAVNEDIGKTNIAMAMGIDEDGPDREAKRKAKREKQLQAMREEMEAEEKAADAKENADIEEEHRKQALLAIENEYQRKLAEREQIISAIAAAEAGSLEEAKAKTALMQAEIEIAKMQESSREEGRQKEEQAEKERLKELEERERKLEELKKSREDAIGDVDRSREDVRMGRLNFNVDDLQRMGGGGRIGTGGGVTKELDVLKKSEEHLRNIETAIKEMGAGKSFK